MLAQMAPGSRLVLCALSNRNPAEGWIGPRRISEAAIRHSLRECACPAPQLHAAAVLGSCDSMCLPLHTPLSCLSLRGGLLFPLSAGHQLLASYSFCCAPPGVGGRLRGCACP